MRGRDLKHLYVYFSAIKKKKEGKKWGTVCVRTDFSILVEGCSWSVLLCNGVSTLQTNCCLDHHTSSWEPPHPYTYSTLKFGRLCGMIFVTTVTPTSWGYWPSVQRWNSRHDLTELLHLAAFYNHKHSLQLWTLLLSDVVGRHVVHTSSFQAYTSLNSDKSLLCRDTASQQAFVFTLNIVRCHIRKAH